MPERYNPERTLDELRAARDHGDPSFREMARITRQGADQAAQELWPDPHEREIAGLGAVVAAASFAKFAEPGRDAPILNCVAYFGLALVDSARGQAVTGG